VQPELTGPAGLASETPPHMEGVPESLRKYEPLLRESWIRRQSEPVAPAA
jgi:hypothetical protein